MHPYQAASPMLATEVGILIADSALQLLNALAPMVETKPGRVTFVNEVQELKDRGPIVVTVAGKLIELILQPEKASLSMLIRVFGRVTPVMELATKAEPPIEVTVYNVPLLVTEAGIDILPK